MTDKETIILKCEYNVHNYSGTKLHGSKIHIVQSEDVKLLYWNSSDSRGFDHKMALEYIAESLKCGETSGSVSVDFCEIMFEIR